MIPLKLLIEHFQIKEKNRNSQKLINGQKLVFDSHKNES